MPSKRDEQLLKDAKARWKQWLEADDDQIKRERADLSFYEGEGQWPEDIKAARKGQSGQNGRPAVPARPCLTINKTREPVRHTINAIRQTEFGVEIIPADDFVHQGGAIDHSEIELREDLCRRIQRESDAIEARMWAIDRGVKCGRGYYGLMTRYVPGKSNDQEVYYRRFYDQSMVALDPLHENADGSDAGWGFVSTKYRRKAYNEEYPWAAKEGGDAFDSWGDWGNLVNEYPEWFEGTANEPETQVVIVREHWYVENVGRELYTLPDGSVAWADELPEGTDKTGLEHRRVVERKVWFCKLNGVEVLEQTEWPSPWIPILKYVGEEMQPYDSQRRSEGMIRPAREPGQAFNYMISAMVETIALAPKAPVVGYAGQFEGFEDQWDQANVRNIPRLEVNPIVDATGSQILPLPQRQQAEPPIQAISVAVNMFDQAIKSTTGIPDPTLGNIDPSLKSGKAIKTLLDQARMGSTNYLDNAIVTMKHEARILNSLLEPIYGRRPGRILRMMNLEGDQSPAIVGMPFVVQGADKQAQAVPFDPMRHQGQQPKLYQLTPDADWNIAVKVSKNYDTRREASSAQLFDLINNNPEMLTVLGDLAFENDDGPMSQQIAERIKAILNPAVAQIANGNNSVPPQFRAQMAQAQGQIQQLQQQLMQATQIIQTEQVKQQGQIEKIKAETQAQMAIQDQKTDSEMALQIMKNASAISVAHIAAASKGAGLEMHSSDEALALGHEALQNELDRKHEAEQKAYDRQHAMAQQVSQQQQDAQNAALSQQQP